MTDLNRAVDWLRSRKRAAVDLLDLAGGRLTPGTYFVDHFGNLRHLIHGRWSMDVGRGKDADRGPDRFGPVKSVARRSIAAVIPPTLLTVRRSNEASLDPSLQGVFALQTDRGNAVLLARDGRNAVRVYRGGKVPEGEARIRPILEHELRLSPSRILEGEGLIVEEYVRGRPLRHLPAAERERIFRELVVNYASLTGKHASSAQAGGSFAADDLRDRAISTWQLPAGGRIDWKHLERPVPVVPSHGDVYADNLLVREDGSYTLIDYERCEFLPFYYDLLNLVLCESTKGRHDLAAGLLNGRFDTELELLWSSAGSTYSSEELWRAFSMAFQVHLYLWGSARVVDWSNI